VACRHNKGSAKRLPLPLIAASVTAQVLKEKIIAVRSRDQGGDTQMHTIIVD
jgi:hypothetical protein